MAEAFSINALAEMLERDRRTVAKALRDIQPDGRDARGAPRWKISSAVRALTNHSAGSDSPHESTDAIEQAARDVDKMLAKLRAAGGVEAARKLLRDDGIGRSIGRLDHALERGLVGLRPAEARLLGIVRNEVIGRAIGEVMDLCAWQLGGAG